MFESKIYRTLLTVVDWEPSRVNNKTVIKKFKTRC